MGSRMYANNFEKVDDPGSRDLEERIVLADLVFQKG